MKYLYAVMAGGFFSLAFVVPKEYTVLVGCGSILFVWMTK